MKKLLGFIFVFLLLIQFQVFQCSNEVSAEEIFIEAIEFSNQSYSISLEENMLTVVEAVYSDNSRCGITIDCEFSSSDTSIVTIDEDGRIYGNADGQAIITAEYDTFSDTATVIVYSLTPAPSPSPTPFPLSRWSQKAEMPVRRSLHQATAVEGKIYAIGGYNGSVLSDVEEYDPLLDTWTQKSPLPAPNMEFACTSINSSIYIFGGNETGTNIKSGVFQYDPFCDTWIKKTNMPSSRKNHQAVAIENKIYIIGGNNSYGSVIQSVDMYNPTLDTWESKSPMINNRRNFAVEVVNGKIYAIGGYSRSASGYTKKVEEYNPLTDTWMEKADMPTARGYMTASVYDNKIYVFGGYNYSGSKKVVEIYDPETDEWSVGESMLSVRERLEAEEVGNKIYLIGGRDSSGSLDKTEEYYAGLTSFNTPQNICVSSGFSDISLDWDDVPFATSYDIEIDEARVENITVSEFVYAGLPVNSSHGFRIRALNENQISSWTENIIVETRLETPILKSFDIGTVSIMIEWANVGYPYSYDIEIDGEIVNIGTSTCYEHIGLQRGSTHNYRLRTRYSSAVSDWSESIILRTNEYTELDGNIQENVVLHSNCSPYIVQGNLIIPENIEVVIEEGTAVLFERSKKCTIDGRLKANGTQDNNIIVSSTEDLEYGGDGVSVLSESWGGIEIRSTGEFVCKDTNIRYGRNSSYNTSISVFGAADIQNADISNPYIGNIVHINTDQYVNISDSIIHNQDYNAEGILIDNISNPNINISSCTIKNCSYGIKINNTSGGTYNIVGNNITKNSSGIIINDTGYGNYHIDNNEIYSNTYHAINIPNFGIGSISAQYNYIHDNKGYPIYADLSKLQTSIFENIRENNFSNNTYLYYSLDAFVLAHDPVVDITLTEGIYIYLSMYGDLDINENRSITLDEGAVLLFQDFGCSIFVNGTLNVSGSAEKPAVISTVYDPLYGGNGVSKFEEGFGGIVIEQSGIFNGDYVHIRYGNYYDTHDDATFYGFSSISVRGELNLYNSSIINGYEKGIYFNTLIQPELVSNTFMNNSLYAVYNLQKESITINAENNYWGSIYGPSVYDSSLRTWIGEGDKISGGIDYIPYLGTELKVEAHFGKQGVYIPTGNYSKTHSDFGISSSDFGISFERAYNSYYINDGVFGTGWTFNLDGSLKDYGAGNVKVVRIGNGSSHIFEEQEEGTYLAVNTRCTLERDIDGGYVLKTKEMKEYGFDVGGHLISVKDRTGNTILIARDSEGKIVSITDAAGRVYTLSYNQNGFIKAINDPMGHFVQYEYEGNRMICYVDSSGSTANYTYSEYDFGNGAQWMLTEISDNENNVLESIAYYETGEDARKVSQITNCFGNTKSYNYDNINMKATATDSNNLVNVQWFDKSFFITHSEDAEGKLSTTEYFEDAKGLIKFGDIKSYTDRNNNTTQYQRDDRGNPIKITNPDSSYREYTYDDKNNVIEERDESGKYTFYVYDSNGIMLLKQVRPLDGMEQYIDGTSDDNDFAINRFEYYTKDEAVDLFGCNISGLLKSGTDPEEGKTTYAYDQYGNTEYVKDPEDNTSYSYFNIIGWITHSVSPKGYDTYYYYDDAGRLEKKVTDGGETTRIDYDVLGRVVAMTQPEQYDSSLDALENHEYNGEHSTRYTYYSSGKVHTYTDAENNTTNYTYDIYGNIETEQLPNGAVYIYEYDCMNRLEKKYFKENSGADRVIIEEYSYQILSNGNIKTIMTIHIDDIETITNSTVKDYAGRVISKLNPDGTAVSTEYNPNGTVKSVTDESSQAAHYKYDGLDRLSETWKPFEENGSQTVFTYQETTYDKLGRKKQIRTGKELVPLYDVPSIFQITCYDYYRDGKVKFVSDDEGRTEYFEYDEDGNISRTEECINENDYIITEYESNHLRQPIRKTMYINKGDLYGNNFYDADLAGLVTTFTYNKNGNMKTVTSPNNHITSYEYDNMNRNIRIIKDGIDEYGDSTTINNDTTYDFEGRKLSETDALGNTTEYTYNKQGFLIKKEDASGNITSYYYDRLGRQTAIVLPESYTDGLTLSEMSHTRYIYDEMGRVKAEITRYSDFETNHWIEYTSKHYTYNDKGYMLTQTDGMGFTTTYTYDFVGNLLSFLDPMSDERGLPYTVSYQYDAFSRVRIETNAIGVQKQYDYDNQGNILRIRVREDSESSWHTIKENTYDFAGNILTQTDGEGNATVYEYSKLGGLREEIYPGDESISEYRIRYQYDEAGNIKYQEDSLGKVILNTYDQQNRLIESIEQKEDRTESITQSYAYDKNGKIRFSTDSNGNTAEYIYNGLNLLVQETLGGKSTSYTYDGNGNQIFQTDWLGNTWTSIYDPLNRLIEEQNPWGKIVDKLEYNKNNMQIKSINALGYETSYLYDKNNRLISTVNPEGHIERISYDNAGQRETKTDGEENTATYQYDYLGNLVFVINAKNEVTGYTYDLCSNMLAQTDGEGHTTSYEYNVRNLLVKQINYNGNSNPGKTITYTYFADGTTKTMTDRKSQTMYYLYDIHGRLINKTVNETDISYTYDGNGNILSTTDNNSTILRTYDERNRVEEKTTTNMGTSIYEYDIITGVPDGYSAVKSTDPKGNISVKIYDKVGRLYSVTQNNETTAYAYDDTGNCESVIYPNGYKEEYTYYDDNKLRTLANKDNIGAILDIYTYTYDNANNQISKHEIVQGVDKGITSYTYDELSRLKIVTESNGNETAYTYDKAGNRLTETVTDSEGVSVYDYQYTELYRLTSIITTLNGSTTETKEYTYDNNGNQLSVRDSVYGENGWNTQITLNEYDDLNQLAKTTASDGRIVENNYNCEGYRIEKTVDGEVTRYLYEYDKVILETDASGSQIAYNTYGLNLIARKIKEPDTGSAETLYYMYNGHADVTALIDENGNVVGSYYYDAFGNILEETGEKDNPFRYAGYQYDEETDLYYLNARYYDSKIARFLQEDTYIGDPNDPLSLNLYTYCRNNPLAYYDPNGHLAEEIREIYNLIDNTKIGKLGLETLLGENKESVEHKIFYAAEYEIFTKNVASLLEDKEDVKYLNNIIGDKFKGWGNSVSDYLVNLVENPQEHQQELAEPWINLGTDFYEGVKYLANSNVFDLSDDIKQGINSYIVNFNQCDADTQRELLAQMIYNGTIELNVAVASEGLGMYLGEAFKGASWVDNVDDTKAISNIDNIDDSKYLSGGTPRSVKYTPVNPGPLSQDVAEAFRSATYTETVLTEDTAFYRVYTKVDGKVGRYMTRVPQNGATQSQIDLALNPDWGNSAQNVTKVVVPKGTVIYEGAAAPQTINGGAGQLLGGGNQVYIPEVKAGWFK